MQHVEHVAEFYWYRYYWSRPGTKAAQQLLGKYLHYKQLTTAPWQ